ncbi:MAG: vanadium-dependent haloperoxidase [Pseudonocardiaceae bacterium]
MKRHLAMLVLTVSIAGLTACTSSAGGSSRPAEAPNAVTDWASIVQPAIHSPSEPRAPGSSFVLHTMAQLAVYDAVVAIEDGYKPYHTAIEAPEGADVRAAVATAAYRTVRGRVAPSQFAYLDERYGAYMKDVPQSRAKTDGIEVGEAAAGGILVLRANDGFTNTVAYQCSADPPPAGEFEPNGGCGTQPVDAVIAQVTPFTFPNPAQFRPDGPDSFGSDRWVKDFNEVKAYGRMDSAVRTKEQTDVVYFWAEHAYVHWNRNLISLAVSKGLNVSDTARLFAMVHTAASDAAIAGLEAKYFYRTWRPRTAIPRAAEDANPNTDPDPAWTPLLTVNHPEYPSGHAFASTALTQAVAAFFGTDQVEWTIETSKDAVPQLVQTKRTYTSLNALMDDVDNARVWAGLHYRNSMVEGGALGSEIAQHVTKVYFRPRD